MEDKSTLVSSRIQKETAYKVIIKNYAYLVEHVDAIRIFPQLVASRLVEQDFRQRLQHKETDKEKMMALLQVLTRCTEETWFDSFTNALSRVPRYVVVAGTLLEDFKKTLEERMANPTEEDASKDAPVLLHDGGAPVVKVTVSGVDEVMKKAMEDAQVAMKETIKDAKEAMKEARRDHSKALSELTKANDRMLEAEKGKVRAEAEKRVLETTVQEGDRKMNEAEAKLRETDDKLREADDKLREAEVHKQLLEKEFELKLKMKEDNATSAIRALERELGEAERNKKKIDEVVWGLKEELEKNHAEHTKVQERQEEVVRGLKEELEKNHAEQAEAQEKQDEVVRGLKEELEKARAEQAEAQEKQDEVVRGLKEELERTLAEQAELQERQEQKVSELVKKLAASNSDRDSLAKQYQDAEADLETMKSELAQTQAELVELQQKYRNNLEQTERLERRMRLIREGRRAPVALEEPMRVMRLPMRVALEEPVRVRVPVPPSQVSPSPIANQHPRRPAESRGPYYIAQFDYTAASSDEVSFRKGDTIINAEFASAGWMTGTVERTGQSGMLPSSYVEPGP